MPKPKQNPTGSFDAFELTLADVYLLTVQSEGEVVVPGLKVVVDQLGLTVIKPDGGVGAVLAWGKLKTLGTGNRMQMPSGTPAVIVEAVSASRTHRFAVPTDDPDGLEAVVAQLAASRSTGRPSSPADSRPKWWQLDRGDKQRKEKQHLESGPSTAPADRPKWWQREIGRRG